LCGAHMQYVIQVMEVLQLKCGVSVNKMVYSEGTEKGVGGDNWIEIEHSTMTIKTDSKTETDAPEGADPTTLNGVNSLIDSKVNTNKRSNSVDQTKSTGKDKSKKRKRQKVILEILDESKVEQIVDNLKINPGAAAPLNKSIADDDFPLKVLEVVEKTKELINSHENEKCIQESVSKVTPVKTAAVDGDLSDEENDVVMVELDEEFVVEELSPSGGEADHVHGNEKVAAAEVVGEQSAPNHRCVLCGRTFRHYMNLQVHLTGHLGVKVNINRCAKCKRNFRNKNELNLHIRSHRFARMLGKFRTKATKNNMIMKPSIITTAGTKDKKIIRKYTKKQDLGIITKEVDKIYKSQNFKKAENLTCGLCDKSFGVKSLFMRHIQKAHPELAETLENHSMLQTLPSIKIKKVKIPTKQAKSPIPKRTPTTPQKFVDFDNTTPGRFSTSNRTFATPLSKGKEMLKSAVNSSKTKQRKQSDSVAPELPDYYNTLECPDCERVFIAKSIFERHLQSAKHGIYSMYSSSESDYFYSPTKSTAVSSDPDSPRDKIECHLCSQTFVRIRDLVKHREKMCQAYHSGKTG